MAIDYPSVLDLREEGKRFSWGERDTMLYALAVGMGSDPLDRNELPFVYEKDLKALPTLVTVVAWGAGFSSERLGLNRGHTLHGEESIILHRPLACAGEVIAASRVSAVYDKGERGAIVERETCLSDAATQELIATITRTAFARADGGFGGPPQPHSPSARPTRKPDVILDFPTRRDQALLYRLCGDRNPLHADPDFARAAGFETPLLHGLCTYGICCRAVIQAFCQYEPARLKSHAVRFSSPVFPGDVLSIKLWKDGESVSFEAEVAARNATVIRNGRSRVV